MRPADAPLILEPLLKARAWGGDGLVRMGKAATAAGTRWGESWEVADLDPPIADGISRVARGPLAGRSLRELIELDPAGTLGPFAARRRFPLLIKFLDAGENLSVQVHPSPEYARSHPEAHLKTEAWVVLAATPGAVLYRGIRPEVTPERFFSDLSGKALVPRMITVAPKPGDCIYLPSGIGHALGAGLLVAEVQTPSDTTYRVFDWDRDDPARPLHVEQARACLRFGDAQEDGTPGIVRRDEVRPLRAAGFATRELCRSRAFRIESIEAESDAELTLVTDGVPVVLMALRGDGMRFRSGDRELELAAGETAILPAALRGWSIVMPRGAEILRAVPTSDLDRMLAGNTSR
jgi:mannose-6-phosphate isomerase